MNRTALVVFFSLTAAVAIADPLKDSTPNISVTGEAHEEVAPDRATIRFGVVTERPTAAEAATENARAAQAIVAELEAQGVAKKDVETQGVTLAPFTVEERDSKGVVKRTQKLFRARNDLSARVTPAEKAGPIAGQLIDKGANSFDGIEFDFSNPEEKLDALRAAAVKDALRRAQVYVEAVGLKLGRVLEIKPEPDRDEPQPRAFSARAAGALAEAAATPVPIRPGTMKLSTRVSVTWALSR